MAKTLLNESLCTDLTSHLEREGHMASLSAGTHDFQEAVEAFVEKRSPCFNGT
jgi:enoyl-CoA hydratase/carnithine racemase